MTTQPPGKRKLPTSTILVLLTIFAGVALLGYVNRTHKEAVVWQTDLPQATTQATETRKKLFLYFTATWCPPCKQMRRTTWTEESVAGALSDYIPVKIDIDQSPDIARQYQIDSVPTMVVLDHGESVKSKVGYVSGAEFVEWLRK